MMRRRIVLTTLVLGLFTTITIAQSWRKLASGSGGSDARRNAAGVDDQNGKMLFLFGGVTATDTENDLWQFDVVSQQWGGIITSDGVQPAARFGHNTVFDSKRRRIILWAGQGGGFFNDVWAFDIGTGTWKEQITSSTKPNQRYGSAAIYDQVGDRLVIFAGFTTSGRFNDTQAFDFSTNTWSDLTPAGTKPNIRCLHTAAYDESRRRMIVFGGQTSGALDDMWAFDLQSNTWTNLTPIFKPPARFFS